MSSSNQNNMICLDKTWGSNLGCGCVCLRQMNEENTTFDPDHFFACICCWDKGGKPELCLLCKSGRIWTVCDHCANE